MSILYRITGGIARELRFLRFSTEIFQKFFSFPLVKKRHAWYNILVNNKEMLQNVVR